MSLKKHIIKWNNRFPFDRIYRQKYNIPFGSKQHRETSPIDAYLDILEDKVFDEFAREQHRKKEALEKYQNKGIFMSENEEPVSEEAFDQLDVTKLNEPDSE